MGRTTGHRGMGLLPGPERQRGRRRTTGRAGETADAAKVVQRPCGGSRAAAGGRFQHQLRSRPAKGWAALAPGSPGEAATHWDRLGFGGRTQNSTAWPRTGTRPCCWATGKVTPQPHSGFTEKVRSVQSSNREKLGFPKSPPTDKMALEDERQWGGVERGPRETDTEKES